MKREADGIGENKQVSDSGEAASSAAGGHSPLELAEIIDADKLQKLFDKFYQLTHIGIGLIDLRGRVLVGTGWQDICTKFHRIHPNSCRLCIESDLELSRNVPPGTFKRYRCKNGMWDIATPIMLDNRHVGNIFLGQFFFDDETPDYEVFRHQARRFGFDEREYLSALDRVPRWSRGTVDTVMSFYADIAGLIGHLSLSNINLAKSLDIRTRNEKIMKARLSLLDFAASHSLDEFLSATLDELENLTGSSIGFYHFLESDQKTLTLQSWSTNTLKNMCKAEGKGSHYDIARAGVWVDCVHERRPVIHNDYASLPHRKGMPQGHAPVAREVVLPIFRGEAIKAIIGLGNKAAEYDEGDIEMLSMLGDLSWDIVERKRVESDLKESQEWFRAIFENAADGILVVDSDRKAFSYCNPMICRMLGYTPEEILALGVTDIHPRKALPFVLDQFERQVRKEFSLARNIPMKKKDGGVFYADVNSFLLPREGRQSLVGFFRDVSLRKNAEETVHRLNRELLAIRNCNQALLRMTDEKALLNEICRIICDEAGYRLAWVGYAENDPIKSIRPVAWAGSESGYIAEAKLSWDENTERGQGPAGIAIRSGKTIYIQDFLTDSRMAPWRESALQRGYRSGIAIPLKDESAKVFGVLLIYSSEAGAIASDEVGLMEELGADLSYGLIALRIRDERRRNEEEIGKLLRAVEQSPVSIVITDIKGDIEYVNPRFTQITGYTLGEAIGKNPRILKTDETPREDYRRLWETITRGGEWRGEFHNMKKNGELYWESASISPVADAQGNIKHFIAVKEDITNRKLTELELVRLSTAVELSPISIIITNLEGRIIYVNRVTVDEYGAADKSEILDRNVLELISPADQERVGLGIAEALTKGKTDMREYSVVTKTGALIPVETIASLMKDRQGNPLGIVIVIRNITERKRAEEQVQQSFSRLRESLRGTIQAMAMAVEAKDPYTAGHQRRVADLARAIATEMNLSAEQIDVVRMASTIHDVGKISIPAEILSKPTKLTQLEFEMIKGHPQSGYEILKDIDFPWPIARIVLEHHERMDGSGYPQGLSGDRILMESRIIAVADTVEAMASHRPYRPALGVEKALEEISLNKGIKYDIHVADLCLKLFREMGYVLQS